jgi:lipopolysaccharide heptosyltransferase II
VNKILIVRPDRVGDVVISSSCLAAVRAKYPQAKIFWMTQGAHREFFENHPEIDEWREVPGLNSGSFFERVARLRDEIEKIKPDVMIALDPRADLYFAAWRVGVPQRVGWTLRRWSWTLTDAVENTKRQGLKHEGFYNFDLLSRIGVAAPAKLQPRLVPAESARVRLREKFSWWEEGRPYAVLNPSAFSPVARWAPENFAQLGDWLQKEHGLQLVIIGDSATDGSALLVTELLQDYGDEVHNVAGLTSLAELAWLLKGARLLVTRDTGPSHVAAAMGCPVVVIFGRTSPIYGPKRWAPLAERVAVVAKTTERRRWESNPSYWRRSFEAITVREVKEAAQKFF